MSAGVLVVGLLVLYAVASGKASALWAAMTGAAPATGAPGGGAGGGGGGSGSYWDGAGTATGETPEQRLDPGGTVLDPGWHFTPERGWWYELTGQGGQGVGTELPSLINGRSGGPVISIDSWPGGATGENDHAMMGVGGHAGGDDPGITGLH